MAIKNGSLVSHVDVQPDHLCSQQTCFTPCNQKSHAEEWREKVAREAYDINRAEQAVKGKRIRHWCQAAASVRAAWCESARLVMAALDRLE